MMGCVNNRCINLFCRQLQNGRTICHDHRKGRPRAPDLGIDSGMD